MTSHSTVWRATLSIPVFVVAASLLTACSSQASPYQFTTQTTQVKKSEGVIVDVRLTKPPSSEPVAGAVITATRLDMTPDGMRETTTDIAPQTPPAPGIFRFKANFTMAGKWQLNLSAQVPGEVQPVTGTVIFTATE